MVEDLDASVSGFECFGSSTIGDARQRKQLVKKLKERLRLLPPSPNEGEIPEVEIVSESVSPEPASTPSPLREASMRLFDPRNTEEAKLLHYAQQRKGLQETLLGEALRWVEETDKQLQETNPFRDEELFLYKVQALSTEQFTAARLQMLAQEYAQLPNQPCCNIDFYVQRLALYEASGGEETELLTPEVLLRNLQKELTTDYILRKHQWEVTKVDTAREAFLKALYSRIEQFQRLEQLLGVFTEDLGSLWDLSQHPFQRSGFELLEQYASLLEREEFLQSLAELLGRQSTEIARYEKELREATTLTPSYQMKPAYRGEISGLRLSDDIAAALPSELVLFKHPATKRYFALKFAQKQLLSYAYQRQERGYSTRHYREEVEVAVTAQAPKGPIIICVDTSGSMHGAPERIAKTAVLALTKLALRDRRACYLISFSTQIEVLDLSSFKRAQALQQLVSFLQMSFNGGTDSAPALAHSLKLLEQNEWKAADVLMVSDFVMNALPPQLEEQIRRQQEEGTGFYSLVIGHSAYQGALRCFNENWNYDPADRTAQRALAEHLKQLIGSRSKARRV